MTNSILEAGVSTKRHNQSSLHSQILELMKDNNFTIEPTQNDSIIIIPSKQPLHPIEKSVDHEWYEQNKKSLRKQNNVHRTTNQLKPTKDTELDPNELQG